jgi:hypothetical protein
VVQQVCKAMVVSSIAVGTTDAEHFGRIILQECGTFASETLR